MKKGKKFDNNINLKIINNKKEWIRFINRDISELITSLRGKR